MWFEIVVEKDNIEAWDSASEKRESREKISLVARALDLPSKSLPRPLTEDKKEQLRLHRAFLEVDPWAPQSLCWVGKHLWREGKTEEAATYFEKSIRSAPYFAAPHHFLAQLASDERESLELLWRAACCPVFATGYTYWSEFSIGVEEDRPLVADGIISQAFARLQENESVLRDIAGDDPLADYILNSMPEDEHDRADLAEEYEELNRLKDAVREWNNVLHMTWGEGKNGSRALESLLRIHATLGNDWAVAMHRAPDDARQLQRELAKRYEGLYWTKPEPEE